MLLQFDTLQTSMFCKYTYLINLPISVRAEFMLDIKNKFTAFISAKEYFKSKLNIYYTVEETPDAQEMEVLIEFFKTKKTKNQNHSVTLHKSNNGSYKCKQFVLFLFRFMI